MITGTHVLLYSRDADADRAFVRDVLKFPFVDVGHGWLIFALPPAEVAVHPGQAPTEEDRMIGAQVYLMCDDLKATIASLARQGALCGGVHEERWGLRTTIALPSGAVLGLYQPLHETALGKWRAPAAASRTRGATRKTPAKPARRVRTRGAAKRRA